jgi:predicted CXXCH cytochrome family protein
MGGDNLIVAFSLPRFSICCSFMFRPATRWTLLIAVAGCAIVAAGVLAWDWYSAVSPEDFANAQYVGRDTCMKCHQAQYDLWHGSDHDRAMAVASDKTVLADFNDTKFEYHGVTTRFFRRDGKFMVNTEGPDGQFHDYEIAYTFGVRPLQQYMVKFPDGRVQVLRESWDVNKKRWFFVTPPDVTNERIEPGDPLHWTGITQTWNTTCADCHSTNVHKNYDPKANTYNTSWEEINVSCEECHGPGSVHVALAKRWSPFWDRNIGYGLPALKDKNLNVQLETCAKCHSRRYQIHEDFRPGRPFMNYYEPVVLSAGLYQADGQILDEVYEYDSFLQSKMHANHVQCTNCHDPHSLTLKFQGNALCTQCHEQHDPAKYDTPAHHHHAVGSAGAQCINCHMASRLYMVIDERRDHSFRLPRPDLSVELGTSNACNNCHNKPTETFQWAADAVKKWFGEKPKRDPHWGQAIKAGRAATSEGEKLLVDLVRRSSTPSVVRATAIDLLANYSSNASVSARRDALRDGDPLVRLTAVQVLPEENKELLVSDLASVVNDPQRAVRIAAATRLAQVPGRMRSEVDPEHPGKSFAEMKEDDPLASLTNTQRKAYEDALVEFRNSEDLTLDHAGGHLALASFDRQHGRIEDAIQHLVAAIKLEPYLAGPRKELASLMLDHGGDKAEIRRLWSEEAALVERDSKIRPDSAPIFYELGKLRYLLQEYDKADTALRAACEKDPRNYDFVYFLALMQQKRYELDDDKAQFNAAMLSVKKMRELNRQDPRAKELFQSLLAKWHARNPDAKIPGEDR